MQSQSTARLDTHPRVSVQTLSAEVMDGPDRGCRAEADSEILTIGTAEGNVLQLTDPTVSRYHLELARSASGVRVTDLGSTNGTAVDEVSLVRGSVPIGTSLRIGRSTVRVTDGRESAVEVLEGDQLSELRGATPVMRRLMAQVDRIARAPVPVLITGESGTGKELVARALHEQSPRAGKPFVTVDCGALTPTLVASALFGHERGAFTGADREHAGAFERADGGTVFLDEIGELPVELQPQLLGVLERRRFFRLGAKKETQVDVRVLSATNRDLREEVNTGTFRLDLYYRVAVVEIRVPALRERVEDMPLLIEHFLREAGYDQQVERLIPSSAIGAVTSYRWPGNVRELRNWVEATVAMGEIPRLESRGGSEADETGSAVGQSLDLPYAEARNLVLFEFEKRYVSRLLESAGGNVSKAAREARMDRSYLIKLLQKHGLR